MGAPPMRLIKWQYPDVHTHCCSNVVRTRAARTAGRNSSITDFPKDTFSLVLFLFYYGAYDANDTHDAIRLTSVQANRICLVTLVNLD